MIVIFPGMPIANHPSVNQCCRHYWKTNALTGRDTLGSRSC